MTSQKEKTATILTDIVSFYGQSCCVMALNGEWAAGKTTFVKMWRQSLINNGFKTLYFNAWTSDYTDDPLLAMVSELKELSPKSPIINSIAGKAGRLIGGVLISASKGIFKKATGIDCDILNNALETTEKIGEEC